jgi:WD40 repeat protein
MRFWDVKTQKQLDVFTVSDRIPRADALHALLNMNGRDDDQARLELEDMRARRDNPQRTSDRNTKDEESVLSPDGRLVLSGNDTRMRLWDFKTGKELQTFPNPVRNMAFLPDGRRVLSVSYDRTAKIWDMASGQLLYTFTKHRGGVKGVAIAPDGQHVFTVDDQGLVLRWWLPPFDPAAGR